MDGREKKEIEITGKEMGDLVKRFEFNQKKN